VISHLRTLCAGLVVTLAASGPIASAATYTVTDLGTLGGTRSYAAGINARGDIVGWSTLAGDSTIHAFLYQSRHGRMIDLDPRGPGASSSATAINDRGRVVGDIAAGGDALHAALFVRGRIVDLGTPMGLPSATAIAINHAGDVLIQGEVGSAFAEGFLVHHGHTVALPIQTAWGLNDRRQAVGSVGPALLQRAVLVDGNTVTDATPEIGAGFSTVATSINAHGDIAGGYGPSDGSTGDAFLERGGVLTDLGGLPGGAFTVAFALNSRDQVVGYAFGIGNGVGHAFLYDAQLDPPMQDLNDLIPPDSGIVFNQATGINDRGDIVGIGTVGQFPPFRAFLLSRNP
jgi:probable HAF family extracellular repeat protein